jgi:hypothetical protein
MIAHGDAGHDSGGADGSSIQTFFLVDSAPLPVLAAAFPLLVLVNVAHFIFASRARPFLSSMLQSFPASSFWANDSLEIDLRLSLLHPLHRFVHLGCALDRHRPPSERLSSPFSVSIRLTFRAHSSLVETVASPPRVVSLDFLPPNQTSSFFSILRRSISDFDSIDVHLTLSGNMSPIQGCAFKWLFVNPPALRYIRNARAAMSLLPLFVLSLLCFVVRFELDGFTHVFCLVLGVAGVFAPNPAGAVLSATEGATDHVTFAAYVALFRLFCATQLEIAPRGHPAPALAVFIGVGLFSAFYVTVAASASLDRAQQPFVGFLPSEKVLLVLDCGFLVIAAALVALALRAPAAAPRLVAAFVAFAGADLVAQMLAAGPMGSGRPFCHQSRAQLCPSAAARSHCSCSAQGKSACTSASRAQRRTRRGNSASRSRRADGPRVPSRRTSRRSTKRTTEEELLFCVCVDGGVLGLLGWTAQARGFRH